MSLVCRWSVFHLLTWSTKIAQPETEDFGILTADPRFKQCDIKVIW
jgi:hypothetical protein